MRVTRKSQSGYLIVSVTVVLSVIAALAYALMSARSDSIRTANWIGDEDEVRLIAKAGLAQARMYKVPSTCSKGVNQLSGITVGDGSYDLRIDHTYDPGYVRSTGVLAGSGGMTAVKSVLRETFSTSDSKLVSASDIKEYSPDLYADTLLSSNLKNSNFLSLDYIRIQGSSVVERRGLIRHAFDSTSFYSSYPTAYVISATLSIYQRENAVVGGPLSLYRVTSDWDKDYVTWNEKFNNISWTPSAGGTFDPGLSESWNYQAGFGWRHIDVTSIVRDSWLSKTSPQPNYGLLLVGAPAVQALYFYTSNHGSAYRPKLTILYVLC